jgi:hypothetical protein
MASQRKSKPRSRGIGALCLFEPLQDPRDVEKNASYGRRCDESSLWEIEELLALLD